MDILLSMRKHWSDMILNGEKPFEFRNFNPKNFSLNDKVYIYESKSDNGCGMVVGCFEVASIVDIKNSIVEADFLPYFCENILKDKTMAKKFECACNIELPNYKSGTPVLFGLDDDSIEYIRLKKEWPPFGLQNKKVKELNDVIISKCDDWLYKIGFFNSCYESNYKRYLSILNPIKFSEPIPLNKFYNTSGSSINRAPQSWQYVIIK